MTMKLFALCFVVLFLLLNGRVAESSRPAAGGDVSPSRRHRHDHGRHRRHHGRPTAADPRPKLFVFGDDFADNGNVASDPSLGAASRSWRYPFGMSDAAHGRKPTGRFSDGLVQSDFLAKIIGHRASPPAYLGDEWDDVMDPAGMNFAFGDSGVLDVPSGVPRLGKQVQQLASLIKAGVVDDRDLKGSVALVAYSGNDYSNSTNDDELVTKVVEEIGSAAWRLLDLGVSKVLVNTVPPFGCSPWLSRLHNYSSCDDGGNAFADRHNAALRDRLAGEDDDVLLLDVNSIMTDLVAPKPGSALAPRLTERLRPCCEGGGGGYCGLDDGYTLCDHPEEYFFWDVVHPTQAGWRAVMQLLQGPIMAFLGISNLEHF
ncbi:GDSL esterase/lipase At5g03600-like [Panicum virgatum]|uniref:GDSL esterase/lipase At5g03600-like n=1 Tax=Panicum virgatum TaxID=38727 RepID=UPI0019D59447|nr:GDSL esterase/lipase At5g03600-like [Panicum virgatum]